MSIDRQYTRTYVLEYCDHFPIIDHLSIGLQCEYNSHLFISPTTDDDRNKETGDVRGTHVHSIDISKRRRRRRNRNSVRNLATICMWLRMLELRQNTHACTKYVYDDNDRRQEELYPRFLQRMEFLLLLLQFSCCNGKKKTDIFTKLARVT